MGIEGTSDLLVAAVEAAAPCVVRVEGRRRGPSSGCVLSADGVIVATHHAVDMDEDVPVGLADGRTLVARVVGRDVGIDLVVLRVAAEGLHPIRWAATSAARTGQVVLGLSRPGRVVRAQLGIVSAVAEGWRTPVGARLPRYLESDIAPHPGFSGGPLLTVDGSALGVNSAGLLRGAGLAVPLEAVRRSVETLLAGRRVRRGFLGIGTQAIALPPASRPRPDQASGLIVLSVQPGSPAAKAGVLIGDVLLAAKGEPLTQPAALLPFLDEESVGSELSLELIRAGQPLALGVAVGERES
jgi:S1-C subfamily serine protease